jgi:glycosyltransferase involved in cell wall biosynthesis
MNQKKLLLSAIVIARNEEDRLPTCLKALSFCDEIIVIDNNSKDKTSSVAKSHGARVLGAPDQDFATLRNLGKTKANGRWLLYIDADEVVSEPLAREIEQTISHWKQDMPQAYTLARHNYYLGFAWPQVEAMKRLFHAEALVEWKGQVHETAVSLGAVGELSGELSHNTHRTLEQMVAKTNEWSAIEAKLRFDAGHPQISWWRLIRVFVTGFWDSFVTQKGYKAGVVGWIESMYQGFSLFITYAKLWELQKR